MKIVHGSARRQSIWLAAIVTLGLCVTGGCWAPFCHHGIPACTLPDSFRTPYRTCGAPLNFATLTIPSPPDYLLGANDVLEVTIHGLYPGGEIRPIRAQVLGNGDISLPLVGAVHVGGLNVMQAHDAIHKAYANGFIVDPRINVYVVEKATVSVVVLGQVARPGTYALPKYENDVGHAIAAAGGLTPDGEAEIEVHRRVSPQAYGPLGMPEPREPAAAAGANNGESQFPQAVLSQPTPMPETEPQHSGPPADTTRVAIRGDNGPPALPPAPGMAPQPPLEVLPPPAAQSMYGASVRIVKIPLRGMPQEPVVADDVVLNPGDVVLVPNRRNDVFYVVGKLSQDNPVRFSVSPRTYEIGAGFVLPRDREIDVVTAVAMAGYIDPIDSPTTVSVQRTGPDGRPMIINVDLIKARYDARETILVQAGDLIYLNPDFPWWGRRTFDRIIGSLFSVSYSIK